MSAHPKIFVFSQINRGVYEYGGFLVTMMRVCILHLVIVSFDQYNVFKTIDHGFMVMGCRHVINI